MYLSRHTHSITGHSFGFGQISGYTEIMARSRKTPKLGRFYHTKPQQIYDDHDGPWSKSCQTIRKQWQRHSQTIIPKKGARKITKKQLIKLNKWMVMMTQHDSTPFQKITPKKETVLNSASKGSRKLKMDSQVLSWRVNRWGKNPAGKRVIFFLRFFPTNLQMFHEHLPFQFCDSKYVNESYSSTYSGCFSSIHWDLASHFVAQVMQGIRQFTQHPCSKAGQPNLPIHPPF